MYTKMYKFEGGIMNYNKLAKWLKFIIIGVGICGALVYAGILPVMGDSLRYAYPEFSSWYYPWLFFLCQPKVCHS